MRKLIVSTFLTFDGVMQAPGAPGEDDSGGFAHGGWSVNYWGRADGPGHEEAVSTPFDLVLGRRTYDIFAAHWPHATEGRRRQAIQRRHQVRRFPESSEVGVEHSVLIEGDAAEGVAALKKEDRSEVQVHGSGNLIQTLMRHNLVDQYRLWVFPLVIGSGQTPVIGRDHPLRAEVRRQQSLHHRES